MIDKIHKKEAKFTNENFEIYKEDGQHYLRADFNYENDFGIFKCHVNKLRFNLHLKELLLETNGLNRKATITLHRLDDDYRDEEISFNTSSDLVGELFNVQLIKEKVQEVTMEEIEKKFGHKIKIVSKKGE